jgi:hypothetical protein|tara:strand:+ start:27422 stop:27748 length:327 start_codon:yes stop_codon:yes gene_type:complete
MKHSIQEILENHSDFKKEIRNWIELDFKKSQKILNDIEEVDDFIKKEKEFLINNIESINVGKFISSLFYMSNKRSERFYAWWNEETQNATIYRYANKTRRDRKAPARY